MRLVVTSLFVGAAILASPPAVRPAARLESKLSPVVVLHQRDVEIHDARVLGRDGTTLLLAQAPQVELSMVTLVKGGELREGSTVRVFGHLTEGGVVRASEVRVGR